MEEKFQTSISIKNICQINVVKQEQPFKRLKHSSKNIILESKADKCTNPIKKETKFG
jgi:hypothetical protein